MKKTTMEQSESDFVRHWNSSSMAERMNILPWVPLWRIKELNK